MRINNKIFYLSDKEKQKFNNLYNEYEKDVNDLITKMISYDDDKIKIAIVDYLISKSKNLTFADINNVINIKESNMIFDVFFDKFKEYLGGVI